MRTFLSASLLLLLVLSCSPPAKNTGASGRDLRPEAPLPCFSGAFEKALFRISLDIREQKLSGFLLIKRTADSSYRIAFANEVGMTLFGLTFNQGRFKVDYLFEAMNKKILVKLFEKDFRYLIFGVTMRGKSPWMKMETFQEGDDGMIPRLVRISNPGIKMTMELRAISAG
jgi:hypothetical protein